jgi:phosphoenolpyruvate carboxykinase (ATP)
MSVLTMPNPTQQLKQLGITNGNMHFQLTANELTEQTLLRGEGVLNNTGALCINTGKFTGRSPKDRFFVMDAETKDGVNWNDFNLPIEEKYFFQLRDKLIN